LALPHIPSHAAGSEATSLRWSTCRRRPVVVMVMIVILLLNLEGLGSKMPLMASPAGYRFAGRVDFANVVHVDHLGHFEHQPRSRLFRPRVISIIQPRPSVRPNVFWVSRVAMAALGPQVGLPLFHDLVHLFPGQGLGQHLQVSRRGMAVMCLRRRASRRGATLRWRRRLLSLCRNAHGECGCEQGYPDAMVNKLSGSQSGISPEREWGMFVSA
jgi:hypothetical protein